MVANQYPPYSHGWQGGIRTPKLRRGLGYSQSALAICIPTNMRRTRDSNSHYFYIDLFSKQAQQTISVYSPKKAEGRRFELLKLLHPAVFKTVSSTDRTPSNNCTRTQIRTEKIKILSFACIPIPSYGLIEPCTFEGSRTPKILILSQARMPVPSRRPIKNPNISAGVSR